MLCCLRIVDQQGTKSKALFSGLRLTSLSIGPDKALCTARSTAKLEEIGT